MIMCNKNVRLSKRSCKHNRQAGGIEDIIYTYGELDLSGMGSSNNTEIDEKNA